MIPAIASKMIGLSVPETDWLVFPLIVSRRLIHHLFSMLALRSRSSGRRFLFEGCVPWVRKKGRREDLTTFAFKAVDFD